MLFHNAWRKLSQTRSVARNGERPDASLRRLCLVEQSRGQGLWLLRHQKLVGQHGNPQQAEIPSRTIPMGRYAPSLIFTAHRRISRSLIISACRRLSAISPHGHRRVPHGCSGRERRIFHHLLHRVRHKFRYVQLALLSLHFMSPLTSSSRTNRLIVNPFQHRVRTLGAGHGDVLL